MHRYDVNICIDFFSSEIKSNVRYFYSFLFFFSFTVIVLPSLKDINVHMCRYKKSPNSFKIDLHCIIFHLFTEELNSYCSWAYYFRIYILNTLEMDQTYYYKYNNAK